MPNSNNLLLNTEQFNFNSFLNQIKNWDLSNIGNNSNSGKNINIILYAPNYVVNKMDSRKNDEMESGRKMCKTENNPSNEENKRRDDCPSNNKKEKKLFDSNFNLLEDECGNDDLSQILKEFVHLSLDTPIKKDPGNSNADIPKKNTPTGDSVNCFRCEGSGKKGNNRCNMDNPYLKIEYKK